MAEKNQIQIWFIVYLTKQSHVLSKWNNFLNGALNFKTSFYKKYMQITNADNVQNTLKHIR